MRSFLKTNDRRRLAEIEYLLDANGWVTLSELAEALNCSERTLKYDFSYFRDNYNDFSIQSSHQGVRIRFNQYNGIKAIYKEILKESLAFQILEIVLFNESLSVNDLAEQLFHSASTLYRLIDDLNLYLAKIFSIQLETNPCRLVGDEGKIRYLYYIYFSEKYTFLEWPFPNFEEKTIEDLFRPLLNFVNFKVDFGYYSVFKLITTVNLTRYLNGNRIHIEELDENTFNIISQVFQSTTALNKYEETVDLSFDSEFIYQVFTPYLHKGFLITFDNIDQELASLPHLKAGTEFLSEWLTNISQEFNLPLYNKDQVIIGVHNSSQLEYQEPNSGHILYNRNESFCKVIKTNYPELFAELYNGISNYRKLVGKSQDEDGIYYLIYNLFTYWENILTELKRQHQKVSLLVISDGHTTHARMIQNLLQYEFKDQLTIDIYEEMDMNSTILRNLDYDIIVSNFTLPQIDRIQVVYIEHYPNLNDIINIQNAMNRILLERME